MTGEPARLVGGVFGGHGDVMLHAIPVNSDTSGASERLGLLLPGFLLVHTLLIVHTLWILLLNRILTVKLYLACIPCIFPPFL